MKRRDLLRFSGAAIATVCAPVTFVALAPEVRPAQKFDEFFELFTRQVAKALQLSYEELVKDYSK